MHCLRKREIRFSPPPPLQQILPAMRNTLMRKCMYAPASDFEDDDVHVDTEGS